ncbi:MAG: signal recognition particle protein [Alphaproteobacteria bacterium]|nr:signal recognition particle protein [Alphaproteobacteria bacterium]
MFDSFSDRISGIFEKLRRSGALKEADVDTALREIRVTLLEADVSLEVARKFIAEVKEKAVGQEVIKSISPGQLVTKIVHDHLVELLGKSSPLTPTDKPYKIMLVGLQGAGKTTTAAKLAHFFTKKNKKVVLASTDIYRPAAIEQLAVLAQKINGVVFAQQNARPDLSVQEITDLALQKTKSENADVLILDTAGRLHIDDVKMDELVKIAGTIKPHEILLVADIMTGQDAINVAKKFSETLDVSGIILTRVDGDARGGVALSMRAITGREIKFLCVGEKLTDLEPFDAERIAGRLLGMGDIVALVEKAQENFSQEEAEAAAKKMQEGVFTFDDLAVQMEKMSKLGGLKTILKMLPQSKQLESIMDAQGISDKTVARNIAIIRSMTKKEKKNHKLLNGSRKKRIALGSGTTIQEVNKLIKQYEGALDFFKKMKKHGGIGKLMSMMGR